MQSTDSRPSPEDAAGQHSHATSSRDEKHAIPPSTWIADQFTRLEIPLVAFVRRRLGSLEQARDVVQEAFVKLCQEKWPEIEDRATAWLYLTCRNRAIDLSRREGRMHALNSNADVGLVQDQRNPQPDQRLENNEQMDQLRKHLNQLTDQQQEVLRLRLHDGLSYRQIAEITGLTVTNVGYHLHQAIAQLRTRVLPVN